MALSVVLFLASALLLTPPPPAVAAESFLPLAVANIIKKHRAKPSQVGIVVRRIQNDTTLVNHNANTAFNPASVTKMLTGMFALDQLGPNYRWTTTFATNGKMDGDRLDGDLHLIGGGDPYITSERFLLMLNDLRDFGIRHIDGDLVVDSRRYQLPPHDTAGFDGVATKPYNVGANAMAVNFKTHAVVLRPHARGVQVVAQPANDHFVIDNQVRLVGGRCKNWRGRLRERLRGDATQMTLVLRGKYAKRCGEQSFHLSVLSHTAYVAGAFAAAWRRLGGEWSGQWRAATATDDDGESGKPPLTILKEYDSLPLASVLAAMNKYSSNIIARHVFIDAAASEPPLSYASARVAMRQWLAPLGVENVVVENGSGLSRRGRTTPNALASVLSYAWRHRYRAEFVASLPVLAVDGTMKKRLQTRKDAALVGSGHFKTGSLAGVNTIAGYLQDAQGRDLLIVILTRNTARARALQDDLIRWAYHLE